MELGMNVEMIARADIDKTYSKTRSYQTRFYTSL
jgi:hypothetical protein